MKALMFLTAGSALAIGAPAAAQTMDHSGNGPGMTMPMPADPAPAGPTPTDPMPAHSRAPACTPEHAAMGHCTLGEQSMPPSPVTAMPMPSPMPMPPPMPMPVPANAPETDCTPEHAAMGHCTMPAPGDSHGAAMGLGGTALPAGDGHAPPPVAANLADGVWGAAAMAPSRTALMHEHGGMGYSLISFDLAEMQVRNGHDGYRWSGEARFGGDINSLTIKSEGEGLFHEGVESAEIQALYSRAIGPYFNLQAGIRQDFQPKPARTYATVGLEGLAPYWFEVEGALFLSDKGDVLARLGGYYDQRITQRLIIQPRAELNLSAQDMRAEGIGSGLVNAELGLRLRYEIVREFAPYLGVSWERKYGDTARFARAAGEDTGGISGVAGIRMWF